MASDSEWDAIFMEDQVLSQEEADAIESACCARSDSGSEHSSEPGKLTVPLISLQKFFWWQSKYSNWH